MQPFGGLGTNRPTLTDLSEATCAMSNSTKLRFWANFLIKLE